MSGDTLSKAQTLVSDLYVFRDNYFEHHDISRAGDKKSDVLREMEKVVSELDSMKEGLGDVAMFNLLKGRALNVMPDHSPEAEALLSKTVKLNPSLVEAWCHLGECFWKRGDVQAAFNCFQSALSHGTDKEALRNLSMALRHLSSSKSAEDRKKDVEEGVEKAKEAVKLDVQDGRSWLVLGNAYLSAFFLSPYREEMIHKAMSAYNQAETHVVVKHDPDLHYNRAVALEYQGEFEDALKGFSQALALDPSWEQPKERLETLLKFLRSAQEQIREKGKLKEKRYQSLLTQLRERCDRDLGPYAGGKFTNPRGETVNLKYSKFSELNIGANKEQTTLCKVMSSVPHGTNLAFSCTAVDAEGDRCLISIFNMGSGKGPAIGDSLAIPEPHVELIDLKWPPSEGDDDKSEHFHMRCLRVSTPEVLVVNGRKMDRRWTAMPVLKNEFFGD